ncbi:GxxExxY protein [Sphingomonas sp. CFBP 13720]|uniref:GxxExxY protein n=1 Tax=Sphingomonas sp. CFBP 13720 TaxID=2775302 RepID=UPI001786AA36|nr:GxxExxY protein [Sphingomonas sp. CFBP 13720]MBD8677187.1 GxxExxY protein [Sphingomonas sp. CFBP 13720]
MSDREDICRDVIDVALRLHRDLGPGLLESVYEMLLAGRLAAMGYHIMRQYPIDIVFDGMRFDAAFRIDLMIDHTVLVEVKSVERLKPVHGKQLLTYLRLTNQPIGLLLNFGGETLKEGLRRIVNNYRPSAPSRLRVNQFRED